MSTIQKENGNSNRGTEGFWKTSAYVRMCTRNLFDFLLFLRYSVTLDLKEKEKRMLQKGI